MLLVIVAVVAVAAAALSGRGLSAITAIEWRAPWLLAVVLAEQIVTISLLPTGPAGLYRLLHVLSYLAVAAFAWLNRAIPWLWLIAVGGACNFAAITANRGVMPASSSALRAAGLNATAPGFTNSGPVHDARLGFLGDIFATPRWLPFANVFSVGDLILAGGLILLLLATTARPPQHRSSRRHRQPPKTSAPVDA